MTLLGLDFDNTLVRYDKLFHQLAVEKGLIEIINRRDQAKSEITEKDLLGLFD